MSSLRSNLRPRVLVPTAVLALLGIGVGALAFSGTPGAGDEPLPPLVRPAAEEPPAEPGARRAAWRKDANAICKGLNAETAELGTPQSRTELVAWLPVALALADEALAELRALATPRRDRADIERMLELFGRFVELEREALAALEADDIRRFDELNGKAFAANDRGNRIARALGARRCAQGGSDESELARSLDENRVVVAVLYSPESNVDVLAIREARAGALLAGAGFVAVNVYDPQAIAPLAAQYGVREAPSVFVFVRNRGALTRFGGYVDRETVAQAADTAALS